jgi:4-amino-4-deoxy-L-arabinose transferase-like glycosyltransferase
MKCIEQIPGSSKYPASHLLLVALAILVAFFLRFAWVAQQGFMEYDEGWLMEAASSMSLRLKGARPDIYVDFKASPVTIFLTAVPIAIWGQTLESIMYPSALLGFLGVVITALVARRLYDSQTAIITLLIGAVSPMQVLFSRTVAVDAPGFFFLSLSYLIIVWGRARSELSRKQGFILFASGIMLALSIAANYRALSCVFLPALIIVIREGFRFTAVKKLLCHLLGFAACLILLDWAMRVVYPPPLSNGFWGAFRDQYHHISSKTFGQGSPSLLPSLHIKDGLNLFLSIVDLDNLMALALFALWILIFPLLFWRGSQRFADLQLGALVIVPMILFGMLTQTAARGLTVTQPFFALAAARGIVHLGHFSLFRDLVMARKLILAGLVFLVTGVGLFKSIQPDVLGTRNAFEVAFKETCVKYHTGVILELDRGPGFYARNLNCKTSVIGMDANPYNLTKIYLQGYRFWLIDGQFSAYRDRFRYLWPSFERRDPDFYIPAETYIRLDHFTSHALWLGSTYAKERQSYDDWMKMWGARLPVFDLTKHIVPLEWSGGSSGWYRAGDAIVAMPQGEQNSVRVAWDSSKLDSGATAHFNIPDYLERPAHIGVGICDSKYTANCDGYGLTIVATNGGIEAKLVRLVSSSFQELSSVPMPKTYFNRSTRVWIRCESGKLSAGFNDTTVANHKLSGDCGRYHPAFVAQANKPLEGLDLDVQKKLTG